MICTPNLGQSKSKIWGAYHDFSTLPFFFGINLALNLAQIFSKVIDIITFLLPATIRTQLLPGAYS